MPIRILDASVVGRIAAGEVVERPSSVAKELMENSIDAGASAITVEVRGGGIEYLRVTDNGCGIEPGQVRLAFENHATSKLQTAEQLDDIRTLGFRGEALPSIASVAHVEMTTRARGQDTGVKLNVDGGENLRTAPVGCPEGTTFVMKDLFYNIPVRRAFLKKPGYEGGLVQDAVARMILGNPGVSIRYITNGATQYHSFGDGKLRHAVFAVYGKATAEQMVALDAAEGGTRIHGLIGVGELAKPTRAHQAFFINGRSVRCPLLSKALEEVCRSRVTIGMYPMCVLNLVLPPSSVDVNVHPNKLEVRFRDEITMRAVAERLLADAFEGERVLRLDAQQNQRTLERVTTVRKIDTVPLDKDGNPIKPDGANENIVSESPAASAAEVVTVENPAVDKNDKNPNAIQTQKPETEGMVDESASAESAKDDSGKAYVYNARREKPVQLNAFQHAVTDALMQLSHSDATVLRERSFDDILEGIDIPTIPLKPEKAKDAPSETAPTSEKAEEPVPLEAPPEIKDQAPAAPSKPHANYRVIGVLLKTYILIEANDSLVMIDQHAAHERLQYEKFMAQLEAGRGSQQLLTPMIVHLSGKEMALIKDNIDVLSEAGYDVEPFGEQDIQVRSVPYILGKADLRPAFMDVVNTLGRVRNATVDLRRAEVMQMSCKSAIKGGDPLSDSEIESLIGQLMETGAPPTCPHGRPVAKTITRRELEKMFKRIQ